MVMSMSTNIMIGKKMAIRNYKIDWVKEFCCLTPLDNSENMITNEITKRIVRRY